MWFLCLAKWSWFSPAFDFVLSHKLVVLTIAQIDLKKYKDHCPNLILRFCWIGPWSGLRTCGFKVSRFFSKAWPVLINHHLEAKWRHGKMKWSHKPEILLKMFLYLCLYLGRGRGEERAPYWISKWPLCYRTWSLHLWENLNWRLIPPAT